MLRPGVVAQSSAAAAPTVVSATGIARARGRRVAVTGKRTSGVDIGDGDRGPRRAAAAGLAPAAAAGAALTSGPTASVPQVAVMLTALLMAEAGALPAAGSSVVGS